jgi:hypothetical protein
MIFAPQIIFFVQSSGRCVRAHRWVTIRVLTGFSMILPFKIPVSLQITEDEYIVNKDSVSTLLQLHLE